MLLTIEDHPEQGTVELHADREGLDRLIGLLVAMRDRALPPDIQARIGLDHDHLFSPAWGGDDLTAFVPIGVNGTGPDGTIVHHLKIYKVCRRPGRLADARSRGRCGRALRRDPHGRHRGLRA